MKSVGDFPKVKIAGKDIAARRRHVAAPRQGRLLLDKRKGHGTFSELDPQLLAIISAAY
jgi:hypothetical protein